MKIIINNLCTTVPLIPLIAVSLLLTGCGNKNKDVSQSPPSSRPQESSTIPNPNPSQTSITANTKNEALVKYAAQYLDFLGLENNVYSHSFRNCSLKTKISGKTAQDVCLDITSFQKQHSLNDIAKLVGMSDNSLGEQLHSDSSLMFKSVVEPLTATIRTSQYLTFELSDLRYTNFNIVPKAIFCQLRLPELGMLKSRGDSEEYEDYFPEFQPTLSLQDVAQEADGRFTVRWTPEVFCVLAFVSDEAYAKYVCEQVNADYTSFYQKVDSRLKLGEITKQDATQQLSNYVKQLFTQQRAHWLSDPVQYEMLATAWTCYKRMGECQKTMTDFYKFDADNKDMDLPPAQKPIKEDMFSLYIKVGKTTTDATGHRIVELLPSGKDVSTSPLAKYPGKWMSVLFTNVLDLECPSWEGVYNVVPPGLLPGLQGMSYHVVRDGTTSAALGVLNFQSLFLACCPFHQFGTDQENGQVYIISRQGEVKSEYLEALNKLLETSQPILNSKDVIAKLNPTDVSEVKMQYIKEGAEDSMGALPSKSITMRSWWETVASELTNQPSLTVDELRKLYR